MQAELYASLLILGEEYLKCLIFVAQTGQWEEAIAKNFAVNSMTLVNVYCCINPSHSISVTIL
jgi:hypothetical protein